MNNERNMFEIALRGKYRFPFKGIASTEDLFDLSTKDLDSIFKTLNSELKKVKEESLLETKTQQDKELDTKIEIVKYIVKTKLTEEELRTKAKERKEQKQKLLELLASKEDEDLQNKSKEELQKMIDELDS
jgi:hypothetical protein